MYCGFGQTAGPGKSGDDSSDGREDNLGEHGYTEQEFQDEQLVDVEEEPDEEDFEIEFEETDDFAYNDSDNE